MPVTPEALTDPRYLARIVQQMESVDNQSAPSWGGAVAFTNTQVFLTGKTVNSTQTTIAHGLSYTPTVYSIKMKSAGTCWESTPPDATNIYLTADANSRTVDVAVGY